MSRTYGPLVVIGLCCLQIGLVLTGVTGVVRVASGFLFVTVLPGYASGKGTVGYLAGIAGEPGFAHGIAGNLPGIDRGKVARTPYALVKLRLQK